MKIIIIGGNPAGLSAASGIRKYHPDWEIVVYEKDQYISYGSCGIPYFVADQVKKIDKLITLTKEKLETERKIPVSLYHEVTKVDFGKKELTVYDSKRDRIFHENYDYLVIAVGGKANLEKISLNPKLLEHPHVFLAHTLNHAQKIKQTLSSTKIASVVIIGSGYIGLEMLEAYEAFGVQNITLIGPRLMFDSESQSFIQKELEKHNIKIILDKRAISIEEAPHSKLKINLNTGEILECDAIQLSIGVLPATDLFRESSLKMLKNGAIIIDDFCRTNIENVYAAGDCATSYHNILQENVYIPLAPTANKQGRIAGEHIAGEPTTPFQGVIGSSIFKVFDLYCARTGISEKRAKEVGYDVAKVLITNNEIAHYYPNARKMSVLLIFDATSHELLGAELTAPSALGAKKIDVFATALAAHMKIEDIQKLDLAYAPPFAPVWDPILIAANIAQKQLK